VLVTILAIGGTVAFFVHDWETTKKAEADKAAIIAAAKGKVAVFLSAKNSQRDRVVVEAEVANYTDAPVDWDSAFVVPLNWKFSGDVDFQKTGSDPSIGLHLSGGSRNRFVRLLPGEKLVKEIELTRGLMRFVCGHYTFHDEKRGMYHRAMGYEEPMWLDIPEKATSLTVELTSHREQEFEIGFQAYFGFDPKGLSLVDQNLWSNILTIDLDK